jgi:tetratricopeptide (TPR) repeat protein
MIDFTPFEDLLAGHAGFLEDSVHDRWVRAQALFEERAYREAIVLLRELLDSPQAEEFGHGLTEARLLLARSYYHSALLGPAIEAARDVLAADPHEPYAHLLIGRSLQRQSKGDEAAPHLKLANLLGGYAA